MKIIIFILIGVALAGIAVGCTKKPSRASSDSWRKYTVNKRGYSFEYPSTWSTQRSPDLNGFLVICPTIEDNWQANAFFELRTDEENRSMREMLEDLRLNLEKKKVGFNLIEISVGRHPSGLESGKIVYSHHSDGTKLIDNEVVIVLEKNKLLFVLTSTAESAQQKYQPTLQQIVNSVQKE